MSEPVHIVVLTDSYQRGCNYLAGRGISRRDPRVWIITDPMKITAWMPGGLGPTEVIWLGASLELHDRAELRLMRSRGKGLPVTEVYA